MRMPSYHLLVPAWAQTNGEQAPDRLVVTRLERLNRVVAQALDVRPRLRLEQYPVGVRRIPELDGVPRARAGIVLVGRGKLYRCLGEPVEHGAVVHERGQLVKREGDRVERGSTRGTRGQADDSLSLAVQAKIQIAHPEDCVELGREICSNDTSRLL